MVSTKDAAAVGKILRGRPSDCGSRAVVAKLERPVKDIAASLGDEQVLGAAAVETLAGLCGTEQYGAADRQYKREETHFEIR